MMLLNGKLSMLFKYTALATIISLIIYILILDMTQLRREKEFKNYSNYEMEEQVMAFDDISYKLNTLMKTLGESYLKMPPQATNLIDLGARLEAYKELAALFEEKESAVTADTPSSDINSLPSVKLLLETERALFPWISHSIPRLFQLKNSFSGRGIAICAGNYHLKYARFVIQNIRTLGCNLPIEVFYIGDNDLSAGGLFDLSSLKGVVVKDITKIFSNEILQIGGWSIKPFATLASSFREVIVIDADAVFLQNPEIIFDRDDGYLREKALFYEDRTLFAGDVGKARWLDSFLPKPISRSVRNTRMYRAISAHEMESGVVYIDKNVHFIGLLAICKLNEVKMRDEVIYKETHGDKESWWIGFEMVKERYAWSRSRTGSIGPLQPLPDDVLEEGKEKNDQKVICGNILHFTSSDHAPFWFNGGMVKSKGSNDELKVFGWSPEGKWHFESSCMLNSTVHEFKPEEKALFQKLNGIWKEIMQDFPSSSS